MHYIVVDRMYHVGTLCKCCLQHKDIEQFVKIHKKKDNICKQCKIRNSLECTETLVERSMLLDGEKKFKSGWGFDICSTWRGDNLHQKSSEATRYDFILEKSIVMDKMIFESPFYQDMVNHIWHKWLNEYGKANEKVYIFVINDMLRPIADVYVNSVNHFMREHEKLLINIALYKERTKLDTIFDTKKKNIECIIL